MTTGFVRRALLFATPCAVFATACADEDIPEFGSLVYEGENFEVWASDGLEACGGTHAYTESWLQAFRHHVGDRGSSTYHRFFWLAGDDLRDNPCPGGAGACAYTKRDPQTIYSPWLPVEHEIVHVELAELVGHRLLTEGAAELFGSIAAANTTDIFSIDALADGHSLGLAAYASAGRFSRYLVDEHGLDAYFELLAASAHADDRASLDAAFVDTLGVSLAAAVEDYKTFAPCDPPRWRYHDYECSDLPVTPWSSPHEWEDTIDLDCAAADVIGPRPELGSDGPDQVWTLRAVEVEEAASYRLSVSGDAPAVATLESCDSTCFDGEAVVPSPRATTSAPSAATLLAPGRYWLRIEQPAAPGVAVTVAVERVTP